MEHKYLASFLQGCYTLCKKFVIYMEGKDMTSKASKVSAVPHSVYLWVSKLHGDNGTVRYVGRTNNIARRTIEHLSLKGDNVLFNKFIIDHLATGILPDITVARTCSSIEQAIKIERALINEHKDTVYNLQ